MPEVTRVGNYAIVIYTRDHPPAHVHVKFPGCEVRVLISKMSCELDDTRGAPKAQEVRRALEVVAQNLDACLTMWEKIHGKA